MTASCDFSSRNFLSTLVAGTLFLGSALAGFAQDATPKPPAYNKVIGEVTSIDPSGAKMSVKQDGGAVTEVPLDANTSFMLVPPGEKDLRKATRIELKDVVTGDRVYARSRKVDGQDQTPAVSVIVMSRSEVAQQQAKSREDWQKRGTAGKVTAVDPASRTITITLQTAAGPKPLVVDTDDKTTFRRYAPDSVKFADAQPSHLADIAPGNNLRVLGDKAADGSRIHAEQIVSGSFRNIAGTVVSVDAANHQIKLNDLITKKPVTVTVNSDTNLRKLAPWMAGMIARMQSGGAAGGQGAPGAAGASNASAPQRPAGAGQGGSQWQGGGQGAPGGPGGGMGRMDPNQMLDRAPHFELADLKPGDALVISSSSGSDASRATAITVVAGVEPILAAAPAGGANRQSSAGATGGMWNLDMAMPQ
jgi:hypothetical protein